MFGLSKLKKSITSVEEVLQAFKEIKECEGQDIKVVVTRKEKATLVYRNQIVAVHDKANVYESVKVCRMNTENDVLLLAICKLFKNMYSLPNVGGWAIVWRRVQL
jgi:hypothetical protein